MLFGKEAIASRPRGRSPKCCLIDIAEMALELLYSLVILVVGVEGRFDGLVGSIGGVECNVVKQAVGGAD